jgi:hypothetical protein
VHGLGTHVDIAFGVQETVVFAARETPVDDLDATDLDNAVALRRGKTGGLRIQNYLSHGFL